MSVNPVTTTVVTNQPAPAFNSTTVVVAQPSTAASDRRTWNTGLLDCSDDTDICLRGTCCTLCLMCQISLDMGESFCLPCRTPAPLTLLRTKWRTMHNIQGSILDDRTVECWCSPCGTCQLAREIKTAKFQGARLV